MDNVGDLSTDEKRKIIIPCSSTFHDNEQNTNKTVCEIENYDQQVLPQ